MRGTGTASPSRVAGRSGTCISLPIAGAIRHSADAIRALSKLADKAADSPVVGAVGDPFMFQDHYGDRSPEQIASIFGSAFAAAVGQVRPGSWQGPIESGLGWHLVFVSSATPGRAPSYDEIEGEIKRGWIDEQRALARQRAFEAMKSHYEVHLPEARIATITRKPDTSLGPVIDGARALRWLGWLLAAAIVAAIAYHPAASAHEARPAYLELTETLPDRYDVVWRTPVSGRRCACRFFCSFPLVCTTSSNRRCASSPTRWSSAGSSPRRAASVASASNSSACRAR